MGIDDWIVFVVIGGAVDVADAVEFVVEAELLSSECRLRKLHAMEGTVLDIRDVNKSRTSLWLEGDGHLIRKWLAGQMLELCKEACCLPAIEAAAVDISRAICGSHSYQKLFDRVKAVVLLGLNGQIHKPAAQ